MKQYLLMPALLLSATLVTGCAPDISPNSYDVACVGEVNRVVHGTVVGMRPVRVNANSGTGAIAGAMAGGALGSSLGDGGPASLVTGVVGAVAAGAAGHAIDSEMNSQLGVEYIIRTDSGKMMSIVQGRNIPIRPKDRVFVLLGQESRIVPEDVYLGRQGKHQPQNTHKSHKGAHHKSNNLSKRHI